MNLEKDLTPLCRSAAARRALPKGCWCCLALLGPAGVLLPSAGL